MGGSATRRGWARNPARVGPQPGAGGSATRRGWVLAAADVEFGLGDEGALGIGELSRLEPAVGEGDGAR